jgi:hypothetical protein
MKKILTCTKLVVLLVFTLLTSNMVYSIQTNYGSQIAMAMNVTDDTIINNGEYCALYKVSIDAYNSFKGSGDIYCQSCIINCKKFEFTGTITCYDQCIINVENDFDQDMFKKDGPGKFIINVGKKSYTALQSGPSLSFEPLKAYVIQFPQRHPFKTTLYGTIITAALTAGIYRQLYR